MRWIAPSYIVTTTITTSHRGLAWEGKQHWATFSLFTAHHITMDSQGDHIPPPRIETHLCICGKKATRGRVSSIACGARANKKNIFGCDFPRFHPARRFGSPVPATSPLEVIFCYCFWVVVRTGEEPIEGLLGEKRLGFVLLWRGLLG